MVQRSTSGVNALSVARICFHEENLSPRAPQFGDLNFHCVCDQFTLKGQEASVRHSPHLDAPIAALCLHTWHPEPGQIHLTFRDLPEIIVAEVSHQSSTHRVDESSMATGVFAGRLQPRQPDPMALTLGCRSIGIDGAMTLNGDTASVCDIKMRSQPSAAGTPGTGVEAVGVTVILLRGRRRRRRREEEEEEGGEEEEEGGRRRDQSDLPP